METPLVFSPQLSKEVGREVWLKLECLQRSGSFKLRGISHLIRTRAAAAAGGGAGVHVFCSSGGNAGLATAYTCSAWEMSLPVTIFVPETTGELMIGKLRALGAEVRQGGGDWQEADARCRSALAAAGAGGVYVPPFDDPLLWEGHAPMMAEVARQLPADRRIAAVVAAVGGGGLLLGIDRGMRESPRFETAALVAAETHGMRSFALACECCGVEREDGEAAAPPLAASPALEHVTGIATSLGARRVADACLELIRRRQSEGTLRSVECSDADAVREVRWMLDHERLLVEPACGAAVAAARELIARETAEGAPEDPEQAGVWVIIVCGGAACSFELLQKWEREATHTTEKKAFKT